jgi:hypothetical protein
MHILFRLNQNKTRTFNHIQTIGEERKKTRQEEKEDKEVLATILIGSYFQTMKSLML